MAFIIYDLQDYQKQHEFVYVNALDTIERKSKNVKI